MTLAVQVGDEVITTPFSFIATAETIALLRAVPVYVDINPATYNLDPDRLEESITPRTRAIIPVSLYGQPADFGATHHGQRSCGLSTIGTTSFFPSKPLGGYGDGGACFTSDGELAERMRRISRHGQSSRYFHKVVNAIAHIDIQPPSLTKERFVAGGATAIAVAGGLPLGIRLRFHNHPPQQLTILLAFHQQAANQLGGNLLRRASKEGLGKGLVERGGYGSGSCFSTFLRWVQHSRTAAQMLNPI